MAYQGKVGVGKSYLFALAFSGYVTFIIKNDMHSSIMIVLSVLSIALSIVLYRKSEGWILAAIVPLPFFFVTVAEISKESFGIEHYVIMGSYALGVLSILALVVFSLLHNLDKSLEEDR